VHHECRLYEFSRKLLVAAMDRLTHGNHECNEQQRIPARYFAAEKPLASLHGIPHLSGGWIYASKLSQRVTLRLAFRRCPVLTSAESPIILTGYLWFSSVRSAVTVGIRSRLLLYILFTYHPASRRCSHIVELLTESLNKQQVDSKLVAH